MDKYTERLVQEWRKHGKIIIAVDFDSTISYWPTIDNREDIEKTIKLLQLSHETGAYIVVFTACKADRYTEIQKHCSDIKIPISGINTAPVDLPYGNTNKIYANIFLDDRAGLREALTILSDAVNMVRTQIDIWHS